MGLTTMLSASPPKILRLLALVGLVLTISEGPALASGHFSRQTVYVVPQQQATLQTVQFAPATQFQFAPVSTQTLQLAPATTNLQLAPAMTQTFQMSPTTQLQLAPAATQTYQLAPASTQLQLRRPCPNRFNWHRQHSSSSRRRPRRPCSSLPPARSSSLRLPLFRPIR